MADLTFLIAICTLFITPCRSQTCPSGNSFPYACGSCLSFSSDLQWTFSQAQNACEVFKDGTLAIAGTAQELAALLDYAEAMGSTFWIGYQYNASDTLVLSSDMATMAPTFVSNEISSGMGPGESVCVAVNANGSLEPVVCTEELGYTCQFTLTDPAVNDITVNGASPGSSSIVANFSDSLSFTCSFNDTDSSSVVQWLLNGKEINSSLFSTSVDGTSSQLDVMFETAGLYQCVVTNIDGRSAVGEVDVCGDIEGMNPPSFVSFVAIPENQTSLFLRWFRPEQLNVLHPLLLRYSVFYSTNETIDFGTTPLVKDLMTDASGLGTYVLTGLSIGTYYRVGIRANSGSIVGADPESVINVTTYGNAPADAPARLQLSRSRDNTALLAEWVLLTITPPTGDIAFYQVEFRSGLRELANVVSTIFIDPGFNFASIFGVSRAQTYEVRVAAAVQVQRSPREYDHGPFTDWVAVTGVVDEVPSPATAMPIQPDDTTTILLAVLVPILFIIVIAIIISVVVLIYFNTRNTDQTDGGEPPNAERQVSASNQTAMEEKEPLAGTEKPSSPASASSTVIDTNL